jgi:hypothetical protein
MSWARPSNQKNPMFLKRGPGRIERENLNLFLRNQTSRRHTFTSHDNHVIHHPSIEHPPSQLLLSTS